MVRNLNHVFAPLAALLASLLLWRAVFDWTDWAALALLPLVVLLVCEHWRISASINRAIFLYMLEESSPCRKWFTGKLSATVATILFIAVAIPVLVWSAETASIREATILAVLCLAASAFYLSLPRVLSCVRFRKPFDDGIAVFAGTWVVAAFFAVVLTIDTFNHVRIPDGMRGAGFVDWVVYSLESNRNSARGPLTGILAYFHAIDAAKLWIADSVNEGVPRIFAGTLYSLDGAFAGFVFARASIALTRFARNLSSMGNDVNVGASPVRQQEMHPETQGRKMPDPRFPWVWFWFWVVLTGLVAVSFTTLGLKVSPKSDPLPCDELRFFLNAAAGAPARPDAKDRIAEELLADAYSPPVQEISAFGKFHYSLPGDKGSLEEAGRIDLGEAMRDRLLAGYREGLSSLPLRLQSIYAEHFLQELDTRLETLAGREPAPVLEGYTAAFSQAAASIVGSTYRFESQETGLREAVDAEGLVSGLAKHVAGAFDIKAETFDHGFIVVGRGGAVPVCPQSYIWPVACRWVHKVDPSPDARHVRSFMTQREFESILRVWVLANWDGAVRDNKREKEDQIAEAILNKSNALRRASDKVFERTEKLLKDQSSGFLPQSTGSCLLGGGNDIPELRDIIGSTNPDIGYLDKFRGTVQLWWRKLTAG